MMKWLKRKSSEVYLKCLQEATDSLFRRVSDNTLNKVVKEAFNGDITDEDVHKFIEILRGGRLMSNLLDEVRDLLSDTSLTVYSCDINSESFTGACRAEFDREGDLRIEVLVDNESLLDLVPLDEIKQYVIDSE